MAFQTSLINGEATRTFVGRTATSSRQALRTTSRALIFMHTTMDPNGNVTSLKVEVPTIACR